MWPLISNIFGPYGMIMGGGATRPNNSLSDMSALTKAYAAARAQKAGSLIGPPAPPPPSPPISTDNTNIPAPPAPPSPPISTDNSGPAPAPAPAAPLGVSMFGPPDAGAPPFQRAINTPPPQPQSFGGPAPMPRPRPPEAAAVAAPQPQQMMPLQAAQEPGMQAFYQSLGVGAPQATGPQLINKMLSYLHNKADT